MMKPSFHLSSLKSKKLLFIILKHVQGNFDVTPKHSATAELAHNFLTGNVTLEFFRGYRFSFDEDNGRNNTVEVDIL